MRRLGWMLMIALAPALGAQEQSDSGALPNADAAQAEHLRRGIRQRWNEHARATLGLSDDQTGQVQATEQRVEQQRQPVRARQRQINQTLNAELSAGTPNEDRVKQLMTARQENQLKLQDRKSTRLNSSHSQISYAVFCLKKKNNTSDLLHDHARQISHFSP